MSKHRYESITENDALHRGYDAGNYDGAYGRKRRPDSYSQAHPDAHDAAYLLGYFSSYETHEVPLNHRREVVAAEHKWGNKMRGIGIGVARR